MEVKFNKNTESKYKRTEFMQLAQGANTIRILQSQVKTKPTHFFEHAKASVLCLGDECPICANNRQLFMKYDREAPKQPGFNRINYRFFINVLDKTPAKVCKCGKEYKDVRQTICTCGEVLPAQAEPLNKVKVLSRGLELRDDLGSISKAILHPDGTPIDIRSYDIMLMVNGTGRGSITPVPRTDSNEPYAEGLELFDLDKAVIELNPMELMDLHNGHTLKDIFAARKAKKEEFVVEEIAPQADIDAVQAKVNALFNQ